MKRGGDFIGWGITCRRHHNQGEDSQKLPCKRQLTYGAAKLSDAEVIIRLKRWVIKGYDIPVSDTAGRTGHHLSDPRALEHPATDEDLDAALARHTGQPP